MKRNKLIAVLLCMLCLSLSFTSFINTAQADSSIVVARETKKQVVEQEYQSQLVDDSELEYIDDELYQRDYLITQLLDTPYPSNQVLDLTFNVYSGRAISDIAYMTDGFNIVQEPTIINTNGFQIGFAVVGDCDKAEIELIAEIANGRTLTLTIFGISTEVGVFLSQSSLMML